MFLLAAGDKPNPLGHVLDKTLIALPDGTPLITMHMVTLVVAAVGLVWIMHVAAKAISTGPESEGHDRYVTKGRLSELVEVMTLYMRDTVVRPVLGDLTNRYLPFLLTVFFFVLANNLLGLIPLLDLQHLFGAWVLGDSHFAVVGGTATGNLAVTGGLALIAFVLIQVHGLRELGLGGWAHHLLGGAPWYLAPIMIPVELMGMFIKPAALAIRLFANMMAGHTLMATLALFGAMAWKGLDSFIAALGVSVVAGLFSVAITFLELFVATLQAFIFMFLTAIFIGQLSHHHDHDEHEAHDGPDTHGTEAAHA